MNNSVFKYEPPIYFIYFPKNDDKSVWFSFVAFGLVSFGLVSFDV